MKRWFYERFLPMWAKETLLKDYRQLRRENARLHRKLREREAYIKGLQKAFPLRGRGTALAVDEVVSRFLTPHQSPAATASPQGEAFDNVQMKRGGKK